jgi:uncharacterized protein involved in type VI secretion and phage assembly
VARAVGGDPTAVPTVGADVWVQFEQGNVEYPVITGQL